MENANKRQKFDGDWCVAASREPAFGWKASYQSILDPSSSCPVREARRNNQVRDSHSRKGRTGQAGEQDRGNVKSDRQSWQLNRKHPGCLAPVLWDDGGPTQNDEPKWAFSVTRLHRVFSSPEHALSHTTVQKTIGFGPPRSGYQFASPSVFRRRINSSCFRSIFFTSRLEKCHTREHSVIRCGGDKRNRSSHSRYECDTVCAEALRRRVVDIPLSLSWLVR